ncbi:MAG: PfaD family polyunsaturated fatty acid/polyketide biosynthesis protein, partial [Phycisphaerae bacterium]
MATLTSTITTAKSGVAARGWWTADGSAPQVGDEAVGRALQRVGKPVQLVDCDGRLGVADGGVVTLGGMGPPDPAALPLVAYAPALLPEQLGDSDFCEAHGLRYAYVAGAMANGIGSADIVEAMARGGMVGFFGSAGLSLDCVELAVERIQRNVGDLPYGFNLIHTPNEPATEAAVVDLYLKRQVRLISASAYLDLTLPLIRYRVADVRRGPDGQVLAPNKVIAKVSRAEVARKFLSPPPEASLDALVREGFITGEQARMVQEIPMAEDLTAEADSGGHTDNRSAMALLPTMLAVAEEMRSLHGYRARLRVGAAGGIATPDSAAAAFAMGAAYVLTGTVNQACRESGTSKEVRDMLAQATQADVTMAPAADMFEMGVKVQVLKWGTMFAVRSRKLYELYRSCASLDKIPAKVKAMLEREYFRSTLSDAWAKTREFFAVRDPRQIDRANRDPKHKMALVFRAYLGQSSDWANSGESSRKADYQIWCGPAMGAFNEWARGSFLEAPEHRDVVTVGMNLLLGAAVQTRANW